MDNAGTVGHGDIIVAHNEECLLVLLVSCFLCAVVERLIFLVLEVLALVVLKNFRGLAEDLLHERGRHDVGVAVLRLDLDVVILRVHAERNVGRKGPRRCGPCKEVDIRVILRLEADDRRSLLDCLVALCDLVA